MPGTAREELRDRIDAIEGAYEFFLAYAAQGLREEAEGSRVIGQFRSHIDQLAGAVSGLAEVLDRLATEEDIEAPEPFEAFRRVVATDAAAAGAAIEWVRARRFASSQLVDNLNASMHVRTLLTDLFLIDEYIGLGVDQSPAARAPAPPAPDPA